MATNSGVNVGGHARMPSQAFHSTSSSGDSDPAAVRSKQDEPVDGSQESQTRGQASEAIQKGQHAVAYPLQSLQPPLEPATPTMQELQHDVYYSIMLGMNSEVADCFQNASTLPPITTESLAELDMPRIINNPKLRHDVNFDRELHFRPNLDGSKGREKMRLSDDYWKALEGELYMYAVVLERKQDTQGLQSEAYWQEILVISQTRLPKLFETIRDILKTLVPDYDQKVVMERLDKDLLMQQIQNGMCDLVDLANWLAKILKSHCAPMRDTLVDRMQQTIKQGALDDKPVTLVNGIKQLLTILEAMKLDVANHQVRHMRPLLIDDTVNFQRRYNAHRIAIKKIDVPRSRLWFDNETEHLKENGEGSNHLEVLTSALVRSLLFNDYRNIYPPTFYLDADRLKALHTDLYSHVYHAVCADVFLEMTPKNVPKTELVKAVTALHMTIGAIVGTSGRFTDRLENIAAEIMRIVMTMEGKDIQFDSLLLSFIEQRLTEDLRPQSVVFEKHARDLSERLLPKLQASVQQHSRLSAIHLQDHLVPALPPLPSPLGFGAVCGPVLPEQPFDPDEDLVRRLTHLIVLHWQVWADLVYLAPAEEDSDTPASSRDPSPASSVAASPMMPVAQAVYAPGRKWLPIGIKVTEVPSGLPTPLPSPVLEEQPLSPKSDKSEDSAQPSSSEQKPFDSEQQET